MKNSRLRKTHARISVDWNPMLNSILRVYLSKNKTIRISFS